MADENREVPAGPEAPGVEGLEAGVVTADAERLAGFYTEAFEFEVVAELRFPQGTVYRLRAGSARFKIFQPADGVETLPPTDPWHRFSGFGYMALLVADADHAVARARRAGAAVMTDVASHREGARSALLSDIDGNVLEILEER